MKRRKYDITDLDLLTKLKLKWAIQTIRFNLHQEKRMITKEELHALSALTND